MKKLLLLLSPLLLVGCMQPIVVGQQGSVVEVNRAPVEVEVINPEPEVRVQPVIKRTPPAPTVRQSQPVRQTQPVNTQTVKQSSVSESGQPVQRVRLQPVEEYNENFNPIRLKVD